MESLKSHLPPVDLHLHTPLCGHAQGEPEAYVRRAAEHGLRTIAFTCHIPMASWDAFGGSFVRMGTDRMGEYHERVMAAAALGRELGVEVLFGIEAEWFPDEAELAPMDALLAAWPFDYVIGSVHPHLTIYRRWFARQGIISDFDRIETYFNHVIAAAKSGRYDAIAHLGIVRHYGTVSRFNAADHEPTIRKTLNVLARLDLALEINTSGLRKESGSSLLPDPLILYWAADHRLPMVVGSDAHRPENVGAGYEKTAALLAALGLDRFVLFRGRQRFDIA